ncbi:MAG: iron export ABC transporter permease subunit FetB [Candidatus Electryoneaceae bacterium]|nr:iron export ABC transporter permease subunit FetB [Candidatus Electryoneaceae bacterium]
MNDYISLSPFHILLAGGFILIAGIISALLRLGLLKDLVIGAVRALIQLTIAGFALGVVFGLRSVWLVLLLAAFMMMLAGREALQRQKVKLKGIHWDTLTAMVLSSSFIAITVTGVVIGADPWWRPSVFIPLLGMILGNSLNGISLSLNTFLTACTNSRREIEERLALGATPAEATLPFVRDAVHTGLIPTINAMAIAGVVSLPGMMTGQLLAGADPHDAVMYQIVVLYMISASAVLGSVIAVLLARKRIFTSAMALRSDI